MRLFAAVVLPRAAVRDLAGAVQSYRSGSSGRVRWTRTESWHLTLAFYGSCTPEQARRRAEWLVPRLRACAPPRLWLAGVGTFRGVLWAGVGGELDKLRVLARAAGAEEAGPKGGRKWHPHVTLARWRTGGAPRPVREAAQAMAGYRGPPWLAADVVLFSSELHPSGSRYTEQARFQLTG